MSSNRFQKSIRELDKDFVDCEKYLNRVLKRNIEKPRNSAGNKTKQNDNQGRTPKPFLTGPPSRPHSSSTGLRGTPIHQKPSGEKLIHKEIIGSSKATVEVTVKAKQKDKSRKRSLSTSSAIPRKHNDNFKSDKSDSTKQSNLADPIEPCKLSSRVFQRKQSRSKSPSSRRLPWSEVLKENKKPQETPAMGNPVKGKCHDSHDPVLHVKAHLGKLEPVSPKPVIKSKTRAPDHHRKEESKPLTSKDTSVSGESSGFSSSIDEVIYVNKSVQCWLPPSSPLHGDSSTTVSSTKIGDELNFKTSDLGACATSTVVDTFSMFNPVRTLNFLIKELYGFVKKGEDKNLRRIIVDMEKALLRIPTDINGGDVLMNLGSYSNSDADTTRLKPPVPVNPETIAQTLASVPALAVRVDSSFLSALDNNSGKTSVSMGVAAVSSDNSAVVFQKQLEESCMKLEAMCQEMEANNTELRSQRDKLEDEIKQKNQELESWVVKERDYVQTVSTLRTNLESSARTMAELTALAAQLREENKFLSGLREAQLKLNEQLQKSHRANEDLHKEIELLRLEKEKLIIINRGKDNELERFKKEVIDIKALVMEQLSTLRLSIQESEPRTFSSLSGITSNDTDDVESLSSEVTPFQRTHRRPVCSSPNSSKNTSNGMGNSWQKISSIPHLNSEHSLSEVLVLSPIKAAGSFKSLEPDSVEITEISEAEDETESNELTVVVQTKQTRELKAELKMLFNEMRRHTKLSSANITVPSPPREFNLPEPGGTSQWTVSGLNSPLNPGTLSASDVENKPGKNEKGDIAS